MAVAAVVLRRGEQQPVGGEQHHLPLREHLAEQQRLSQVDVPFEKIAEIDSFFGEQTDEGMLAPALQAELQRAKDRIAALTKRVEALEC